ncbi:hypothetical protein Mth01_48580 [Sphaerimonospora thailandensis]|uniref:Uncharacterized protein n=1 Tax=Sphaerimonospora thailandensis TaxID=795644 RepID=A0A8J3W1U8_9ACTN|nr:hypothetical protein Mth01_48580 [Sphaerimonospora thailandensis]
MWTATISRRPGRLAGNARLARNAAKVTPIGVVKGWIRAFHGRSGQTSTTTWARHIPASRPNRNPFTATAVGMAPT